LQETIFTTQDEPRLRSVGVELWCAKPRTFHPSNFNGYLETSRRFLFTSIVI